MTTKHFILLARYSFWVSFGIGSVLFLIFTSIPHQMELLFTYIGIFYIVVALIYNALIFLWIAIFALIRKKDRKRILFNASLMLLNIPITFLYLHIIFNNNQY